MKRMLLVVVLPLFMCGVTKVTIASDICGYVYDINDKGLSGVEISAKGDYKVCSDATLGSGHY